MNAHTCDVAVIGGGVIGCAVVYCTAKQGASVTVIERAGGGPYELDEFLNRFDPHEVH